MHCNTLLEEALRTSEDKKSIKWLGINNAAIEDEKIEHLARRVLEATVENDN